MQKEQGWLFVRWLGFEMAQISCLPVPFAFFFSFNDLHSYSIKETEAVSLLGKTKSVENQSSRKE